MQTSIAIGSYEVERALPALSLELGTEILGVRRSLSPPSELHLSRMSTLPQALLPGNEYFADKMLVDCAFKDGNLRVQALGDEIGPHVYWFYKVTEIFADLEKHETSRSTLTSVGDQLLLAVYGIDERLLLYVVFSDATKEDRELDTRNPAGSADSATQRSPHPCAVVFAWAVALILLAVLLGAIAAVSKDWFTR
jgi:hypothetical protein